MQREDIFKSKKRLIYILKLTLIIALLSGIIIVAFKDFLTRLESLKGNF